MQNTDIREAGNGYDLVFSGQHLRHLPPDLQKKAQVELREDPEGRHKEIEDLRRMVLDEPGWRINTADTFLIRYLRAGKYDKEKALKSIKTYFKLRKDMSEIYNETLVPSSKVRLVFERSIYTILPKRDDHGRPIIYYRQRNWDAASELRMQHIYQALALIMEMLLQDESVQISGITAILDYEGMTWQHLRQLTPRLAYKLVLGSQGALPMRIKGVHFVHENLILDLGYALVKPFLSSKLKRRLFFHGNDVEGLQKHFKREILPNELGGTLGTVNGQEWLNVLLENEDHFIKDTSYGFQNS